MKVPELVEQAQGKAHGVLEYLQTRPQTDEKYRAGQGAHSRADVFKLGRDCGMNMAGAGAGADGVSVWVRHRCL